jgi:hypothetical protein
MTVVVWLISLSICMYIIGWCQRDLGKENIIFRLFNKLLKVGG